MPEYEVWAFFRSVANGDLLDIDSLSSRFAGTAVGLHIVTVMMFLFFDPRKCPQAHRQAGASFAGFDLQSVDDMASDYARVLIHGPQGSGKSTLASTIAEIGKTLFIDLIGEKGVRSFQGATYAKNIQVIRPDSITALDDLFWALDTGEHDYKAVVIDSLTSVQKMTMRFLLGHDETAVREIRQGTAPGRPAHVGPDARHHDRHRDVLVRAGRRPARQAHARRHDGADQDHRGRGRPPRQRTPDVQKGAMSIVLAAPDYIVYTDVEDNMDAIGDDTLPPVNHIVRFGANPEYRTKGRIPVNLRGKLPPMLGRSSQPSLTTLGSALGMGGIPAAPAKRHGRRHQGIGKENGTSTQIPSSLTSPGTRTATEREFPRAPTA